jgi:hypothetical protein
MRQPRPCLPPPQAPGLIVCDHAELRRLGLLHDVIQQHSMHLQQHPQTISTSSLLHCRLHAD